MRKSKVLAASGIIAGVVAAFFTAGADAQVTDLELGLAPEDTCQPQPDCRLLIDPPPPGKTIGLSESSREQGVQPRMMRRKPKVSVTPPAPGDSTVDQRQTLTPR